MANEDNEETNITYLENSTKILGPVVILPGRGNPLA